MIHRMIKCFSNGAENYIQAEDIEDIRIKFIERSKRDHKKLCKQYGEDNVKKYSVIVSYCRFLNNETAKTEKSYEFCVCTLNEANELSKSIAEQLEAYRLEDANGKENH